METRKLILGMCSWKRSINRSGKGFTHRAATLGASIHDDLFWGGATGCLETVDFRIFVPHYQGIDLPCCNQTHTLHGITHELVLCG